MEDKLPEKKAKKKIDLNRFVKRAKELRTSFEEEMKYLRKKELENGNILSGKSI